MDTYRYEYRELKDYKGFGIDKAWKINFFNKKIFGSDVYLVSEDDDYIGEEYKTLADAKRFIDSLVRKDQRW